MHESPDKKVNACLGFGGPVAREMVEFKLLLEVWKPYETMEHPLAELAKLWGAGGCGIWVSASHGPAVPYPPVDHRDGNFNHGYLRLKGNVGNTRQVPETQGWPELQKYLEIVNAHSSPIESVGCEKGYFPGGEGMPAIKLGSYVDVIFTDTVLNDRPENLLMLAWHLARAVEGCEKWWADVSFALQRMRGLAGVSRPWGLELNLKNYGRSEEEARKLWGTTLARLSKEVAALPRDFRYAG